MRKVAMAAAAVLAACAVRAEGGSGLSFKAGADLRIRQEIMGNVPGLPGGGLVSRAKRGTTRNHVRFRPDVWTEVLGETENWGSWRFRARLLDEFRWNVRPKNHSNTFPDELVFDNLFIEAKGLFDGFLDFRVGRQDLWNYCGLEHVFVDGTPGDGSRSIYTDMAAFRLNFSETDTLDLFALYNFDDADDFRWGTKRGKHKSLSGLGGGAEPDMDDFGFGAIWGSRLAEGIPYQVFLMQKNTRKFRRGGETRPRTRRELAGVKVSPRLDEEWSLDFEGMTQFGRNGDGATLSGWSAYAGANWKSARKGAKPFAQVGYRFMSGDRDAADEDGGHRAWDPMWSRGVNDSELFLYGTHYGAAWWSNLHYLKFTAGIDFGPRHNLGVNCGPLFAAAKDGMGGGSGMYKGFLSQARYEFPIRLPDRDKGERLEIFAHLLAELFNPGDYYETDKPSYFLRWQIEFRF